MKGTNPIQSLRPPAASSTTLDRENLEARRAAAEAIEIGRATLAQTAQQGEQLRRAERVADDAQYAVDKAGRVLRGMTWSGWVANLFTGEVAKPSPDSAGDGASPSPQVARSLEHDRAESTRDPPLVYDEVPESCRDAAQAVQNYHANLLVLLECETAEQRATCRLICDDMHRVAERQVQALLGGGGPATASARSYYPLLAKDLKILRSRQIHFVSDGSVIRLQSPSTLSQPPASMSSSPSSASSSLSSVTKQSSPGYTENRISRAHDREDEHLSMLSQSLDELGNLASSMGRSLEDQNRAVDRLNDKSDSIAEQTQRVTRRAERMSAGMSTWWPGSAHKSKPSFVARVVIRHEPTGRVLAPMQGDLYLITPTPPPPPPPSGRDPAAAGVVAAAASAAGVFLLYRRGMFVGLKHEASKTWMGQNLFGSLACTASTMGSREEWQVDDDSFWQGDGPDPKGNDSTWSSLATALLCASAGWGAGGYLHVRPRDQAVLIGGSSVEDKKQAARWTIQNLSAPDQDTRQ